LLIRSFWRVFRTLDFTTHFMAMNGKLLCHLIKHCVLIRSYLRCKWFLF
jgi:hypothetical protein